MAMLDAGQLFPVVAIARGIPPKELVRRARELQLAGVPALEVTFPHGEGADPAATLEGIAWVLRECPGLLVGAGTVLSAEEAALAQRAGARFALSPHFDPALVERELSLGLLPIPGALTPSEVVAAHRAGAPLVKVFPAAPLGAQYIRDLRGPLPHIPLMAVGGIGAGNAREFRAAGCC
ncbi:MAG: bifunctional 4-hydroxy-2-oxoglutarate aldolase/2-dehydro-3-deoxy-phosphogluconate aldolase, partial [Succinivibrionaceae bacterium]|nr:bifunctional 4-hydroxy-2-oxoglutarate aldolase/2-dehydro-3-deoxy-phosphogluconate aldolase [Succinivibrionaceae bacterium]